MLKRMKRILGILLVVCFLMSLAAASENTESVVVKEKKKATVMMKDIKTKIFKHHHNKDMTMKTELTKRCR